MEHQPGSRQRIDKWLFFARIVKSRTLAAALAQGGHVRVNREKISQAAYPVKPDDVLTIALDHRILVLKVLLPGTRRGPAPEAQTLYADLTPPPEPRPEPAGQRIRGEGRPEKKERRQIDRLKRSIGEG